MNHAADPPSLLAGRERNQVQVIGRAAAILRALEGTTSGLSLGQIALRVALPRSTVQRIVAALIGEQFLIAASPGGRVRLGPALLRLAGSVETDSLSLARPLLSALSAELRETVDFSVVRRDHLVFIDQVIGPERLRTVSAVGETFPLYCTANGKAFLATLTEAAIVRRIGRIYERRTPATRTSLAALLADLDSVRATGVACDMEEHTLGICAAGVALTDMLGNPVAISVPVPAPRFAERREAIRDGLLATRAALAGRFGTGG